jgi:hypothetical protein
VSLWRYHEAAVEGFQIWRVEKEVQNLGGVEIHQSVVHEDARVGWVG